MSKRFIVSGPYNKENIVNMMNDIRISNKNNVVSTYYKERLISISNVSDMYEIFDFPSFSKSIVEEIENYFIPETYTIRIIGGYQELRLTGEDFLINDDVYKKMFNVFNSTDKTRRLSINTGLQNVTYNTSIVMTNKEKQQVSVKHFKSKMTETVSLFVDNIKDFDINIKSQVSDLIELRSVNVSFKKLICKMLVNKEGDMTSTTILRTRAFIKNLLVNDVIPAEMINDAKNIHNIIKINKTLDNVSDISLNCYDVVNLYTKTYSNRDSFIIRRETDRIINLMKDDEQE